MYRIAHFSDTHLLGLGGRFEHVLALVEDARRRNADHLVLSGDIVEAQSMDTLAAFLLRVRKLGFADGAALSVVPGNHDIFPAPAVRMPLRPAAAFLRFDELTAFARRGRGCVSAREDGTDGGVYPFAKRLDARVVLMGLNSTTDQGWNPRLWPSGRLTHDALEALSAFFAQHSAAPHRVAVLHHYPYDVNYYGGGVFEQNFAAPPAEEVRKRLRAAGATLVLCGHLHAGLEDRRMSEDCLLVRSPFESGQYQLIDLFANGNVRVYRVQRPLKNR